MKLLTGCKIELGSSMITIIGRGHGGTRAISHTLSASGVFMGEPLNRSGDLLPPEPMYEACRVMARYVRWLGGLQWDFAGLHTMPIPAEFTTLIEQYLTSVRNSPAEHKGWKIPETTLVMPWIVRLFPDAYYIHWVRNPRDNILARHLTDDLHDFGIDYPDADDFLCKHYESLWRQAQIATELMLQRAQHGDQVLPLDELRNRARRAISWQYQYEIVKATPKPRHWIVVRFEDFVLDQEATLTRLEEYLGISLVRIPVRSEAVGRYSAADGVSYFDFLHAGMQEYGYETPEEIGA
jgi:hypothetical protein